MVTSVFAQEVTRTEDDKTITIVEATQTPDGKVETTTVIQKDRVFVNGFLYNWELSGGLGTQMYYGENDWKMVNKLEMFAFPSIDLYLTKWASPYFGVGIGANVSKFKGIYQNDGDPMTFAVRFKTNEPYTGATIADYGYQHLTKQKGYYGNVFAQFGMRYAMDFIPYVGILAAMGLTRRPLNGWKAALILLCVWFNMWGPVYWNIFYK